jgi:hypothetical protein
MEAAINRGKKEYPDQAYFYTQGQLLEQIRQTSIPKEIEAYRNEGHNIPAIIGQKWEEGGKFLHHFFVVVLRAGTLQIEIPAKLQFPSNRSIRLLRRAPVRTERRHTTTSG